MEKYPIIRTIYLYLFALIGLAMLAVGFARLIDLGLKVYIFTKADVQDYSYRMPPAPPTPYVDQNLKSAECLSNSKCNLTDEQKQLIKNWLDDYRAWQSSPKIDYRTSQRHTEASNSLSLIIVGLPLYLYHWLVIKQDIKRRKEESANQKS